MSNLALKATAAGASSTTQQLFVDDVFSTFLYTGTGSAQTITNGISLGPTHANGTVLHLTGDALTDSAPLPSSFQSNVGPVTVNTTTKKYGTGSLYFNGSSKIITSSNNNVAIAANEDFTVEAWIYPTYFTTDSTLYCIATPRMGSGNWYFGIYFGKIFAYDESIGTFFGNGNVTANTWQHVAYSRQGTTHRLFLNGVLTDTITGAAQQHPSPNVSIGSDNSGSTNVTSPFHGYIDDLRVTKCKALYTANFTPPAEALPLDTIVPGSGGMVWLKNRTSGTTNHRLFDTARGIAPTSTNAISTNDTSAQVNYTNGFGVNNVYSNGFGIGNSGLDANNASNNYVSWTFRKAPKFFDVVTYTGDGAAGGRYVPHNLGSVPGFIIVKRLDGVGNWTVGHRSSVGAGRLNSSDVFSTSLAAGQPGDAGYPNVGASTATQFFVANGGSGISDVNATGAQYVAYLFAHDTSADGIIQCGSLTKDGSGNATVNLGWEPQYILIKSTNGSTSVGDNWLIADVMRGASETGNTEYLYANASSSANAGGSGGPWFVPTATGFKIQSLSGGTNHIYLAIRRPNKPPTSGTQVYFGWTGSTTNPTTINTGFSPDLVISHDGRASVSNNFVLDRLRGSNSGTAQQTISTNATSAEVASSGRSDLTTLSGAFRYQSNVTSLIAWAFRRAPGFFDVVCYRGAASGTIIPHRLGVAPELIIIKSRSAGYPWIVWNKFQPSSSWYLQLNSNIPLTYTNNLSGTPSTFFNSDTYASTATHFGVSDAGNGNVNDIRFSTLGYASPHDCVAYLFATLPGISKVGSYTGNGSSQTINCGFSTGARFVLIKRTDSTGDWYVWDSARGIVAANDPHLSLNTNAAEVTTDDSVDPDNSGFIVNQNTATNINVNGATYIYLAIA